LVPFRIRSKARAEGGLSLIEVIVVLAVIGVLGGVLAVIVVNYLEDARKSKAHADVKIIGLAILRLTRDVTHFPFFKDGSRTAGDPEIDLLRGPGKDPVDNAVAGQAWLATTRVGELEDHLVRNNPGGAKYPTTGPLAWRGPYLEKITEDPWGNRYLVNVKNANPANVPPRAVWVLSAGPNGRIETRQTADSDSGPVAGGDDIAIRIK
jgi:type II secretory pathway pseudopilin PulG